jgi:Ser/Thr protein kinase RdoA (MazF antagonist)
VSSAISHVSLEVHPVRGSEPLGARAEALVQRRRTAHSIPSIDRIRRLLQHYDLGDNVEGALFIQGVNDTYVLSTPTQRFALKVYRAYWRSHEAVMHELAAIQHLAARDIPVARPIARNDGKLISNLRAPEGLRQSVLSPWASGCAPKYSDPNHALQFGRTVARMHIAGDDFHCYGARPRMDMNCLFRRPVETIKGQLTGQPLVASRLERLAERIEARISRVEAKIPDWGFCHGDIYANNARIDGDHLVLFDFDFCGQGWRVFDLATYRWQARLKGPEQAAWTAFLEGYLSVRRGAAASLEFVELFMLLRHLWHKAHIIGLSGYLGISLLSEEFLEDAVAFCEKLESESG